MIISLLTGFISQEELLNNYNASISYTELPKFVYGFVFNYKGINNIIINNNLSSYKQKKTILHELAHIELNQLEQADNDLFAFKYASYEDEADRYLKKIKETINK